VLSDLTGETDARVLVDYRTADDAGVFALSDDTALVQTVDFFTPIVDDPFTYGEIAAANSLSDVYAMGGVPLTALAIAGFPVKGFDSDAIRRIFAGGHAKLREAGVALLGGHTVQDPEVKFGYAVTGIVHPGAVWTNASARVGDALLLTKPLGTGIATTALKFDRAPADLVAAAIESMRTLNKTAADVLRSLGAGAVSGCTDITGFGLIGHACEVAEGSGVTVRLAVAAIPLLPGVVEVALRNRPGGGANNEQYFMNRMRQDADIDPQLRSVLFDPQTSGGLLACVDPARAAEAIALLRAGGVDAYLVGEVAVREDVAVVLS
jgi:selenide,water dikinase